MQMDAHDRTDENYENHDGTHMMEPKTHMASYVGLRSKHSYMDNAMHDVWTQLHLLLGLLAFCWLGSSCRSDCLERCWLNGWLLDLNSGCV